MGVAGRDSELGDPNVDQVLYETRAELEYIVVENGTHGLEFQVDIGQIRERVVHVIAAPQPQSVEPVVSNRCLGLWNQSVEVIALASEINKDFDRNASVFCRAGLGRRKDLDAPEPDVCSAQGE